VIHGTSALCGLALALVLSGCFAAGSRMSLADVRADEPGWTALETVPTLRQTTPEGCGETVLAMLLRYWGHPADPLELRATSGQPATLGLRAGYLRNRLRAAGLEAHLLPGTPADLAREIAAGRPVILGIARPAPVDAIAHYVLVVGHHARRHDLLVADPDAGLRRYDPAALQELWAPTGHLMIVASRVGRRPGTNPSRSSRLEDTESWLDLHTEVGRHRADGHASIRCGGRENDEHQALGLDGRSGLQPRGDGMYGRQGRSRRRRDRRRRGAPRRAG
jgi:hypothetical protein